MLVVRVLGGLALELDDRPLVPPRRRPARALLGWLALHPGMHARSTVAGRLWPYVLDTSARTSLRTALTALRGVIGEEADRLLLATREQVGLADPAVWVDSREFERLRGQGRLEEALELCRGELLAGLDDDWILAARDAQRAAEGELLGTLAAAAADNGDHAAAVSLARRRVALDPLDEAAQRDFMELLAAAGDRAGALAGYRRFAENLRRELGVPPSPPTRALAAELRSGAPSAAATADDERASPRFPPPRPAVALPSRVETARRRGPLLAREEPLAALRALWGRSAGERRQLALVYGEPGIGKTRLVSELAAELHEEGAVVLYGRAEQDAEIPYQPLVECLREPLEQLRVLPDEVADLADLLPNAARRLGRAATAATVAGDASGGRLRLFDAFGAALDAIADERPLLVVLDDLQWAERSTVRLLSHLARRPAGPPRLLVAVYRDTDVDEAGPLAAGLVDLERELPTERIPLPGLSPTGVAALLERTAAGQPPGDDVTRAVHSRTGGNPFFIEQLVRQGDPLAPNGRGGQPPAAGIGQVVSGRVGALGPGARAVLDAAAISGPEFELPLVAEVAGTSVDDALDVLDNAVRARLVAEVPGEPGRYTFVHAIVRDALTGSLTAARRSRLHGLVAAALEQRAARAPDRYLLALANHALEAARGDGDAERATDLAEQAAGRAGAVLAHEDAADLLRRALSVLERHGGTISRRAELLCALAEAQQRAGAREEARATLRHARALARDAGRPDLVARAALATAGAGVTILGVDPGVVAELEDALGTVGSDNPALRIRLLARLAIELAYDPDADRRDTVSEQALELARRLGDPAALAAALSARHVVLWGPDHTRERLDVADEMVDLARRARDGELALQARNWRIVDLLELGDGPRVRLELDAYAALSAEARLPAYAWYLPMWHATMALLEGRIGRGLELARRAQMLGRRAGDANAEVCYAEHQLLRLVVEQRAGDLDPAAVDVDPSVTERSERGPAWRAYRFTFAWVHAERGELQLARRDYEDALADGLDTLPRDVNWLSALSSAAQTAALLDDAEQADQLRTLLAPYAEHIVVTARGASYAGSVAYHLALLAATCGDHEQADHLFTDAARRDEHAGAPAMVVRDLEHHGRFLRRIGQRERATRLRECAARQARAIGLETGLPWERGRPVRLTSHRSAPGRSTS